MREFRAHHAQLTEAGVQVAGISTDSPSSSREWGQRMELPYPLLSDVERRAGTAFGVVRRIGIGTWNVEFFRRTTFLVDARGIVSAVWEKVKVRGHALEVARMARALSSRASSAPPA